jgi:hypothetical protein
MQLRCNRRVRSLVGGSLPGSADGPTRVLFGLARLNANGTLDSTFGSGGSITTALTGNAGIKRLLVEANGDIVAVGGVFSPSTRVGSVALAQYLATERCIDRRRHNAGPGHEDARRPETLSTRPTLHSRSRDRQNEDCPAGINQMSDASVRAGITA